MVYYIMEGVSAEAAILFIVILLLSLFSMFIYIYRPRLAVHPFAVEGLQAFRQINELSNVDDIRSQTIRDDVTCPICMNDSRVPVETNCGHVYCGNCFLHYWEYNNILRPLKCALCQRSITLVNFILRPGTVQDQDTSAAMTRLREYNRKFSGNATFIERWQDFPVMLRYAIQWVFSVEGLLTLIRINRLWFFIAAVLYIFLPFDLMPEALLGFLGLVDDCFIILIILFYVTVLYRNFVTRD